ncbi:alpha/beta hydrolase family protein [Algibacillus agarilyticus]|uniref:alpha/beta hydrolase family protein n=1 Tax=Algibacillus agarilyticus TaxID=2234133 RepID=UPI000DD05DDA|nr:alpha/beta fold hydrolase [Algibacillus agarilyticus]
MNKLVKQVIFMVYMMVFSELAVAAVTLETVKGAWLGVMDIPNGPSLRIGVEVFQKADNEWGGNVASLDQNTRYMLVSSVSIENDVFTLKLADAPVSIVGKFNTSRNLIMAKFKQGESVFDLNLHKVDKLPELERKQTPSTTNDYLEQEVSYQNKHDKTWLSGTLTLPIGTKKHPAIMLIAGSGPTHRDSYHAGHRTFKVLADHLTRLGFVVLRSDKRGVYKSSGKFADANLKNLVADTQSAVQFLKSHQRVNAKNIILIGHSEGSLISVMTAKKEAIQGIVSLAGPGLSVLDILLLQDQTEPRAKGATQAETDLLLQFSQRFYHMVLNTQSAADRKHKVMALYDDLKGNEAKAVAKWVNKQHGTLSIASAESDAFYHFLQQSPLPYWEQFNAKALILNGNKDSQVPALENVTGIINAINDDNQQIESHILEGLNHLFQPAISGSIDEYREIEQTIDEQVLSLISTWLQDNFE